MESMDWRMDVNQVKSSWVSLTAARVKSCFSEGSPSEVRFCPHYTITCSLLGTISQEWLRKSLTKTRLRVWRRWRSECQIQMGYIWLCRHLAWTQSNHTYTHEYTNTHSLSSIFPQIHVCHWAPSGYAGSGETSRAKFRKQLREITAHQWNEFQFHSEYVSVSQKVSLVKSLTLWLETTKEEKATRLYVRNLDAICFTSGYYKSYYRAGWEESPL